MGVKLINSPEEFEQIVNSGKPVLIDFSADWCGPCQAIAPKFKDLADTFEDVEFYKIDIDQQPQITSKLEIAAVPTFMLFKDGKKLKDVRGANLERLRALVNEGASLI